MIQHCIHTSLLPFRYDRYNVPGGVIKMAVLIATTLFFTCFLICLLLYTKSMFLAKSDSYVAMVACFFWIVIIYFVLVLIIKLVKKDTNLISGIPWKKMLLSVVLLTVFFTVVFITSLPWRTSPRLQFIVMALHIPFTAVANYAIFHRGGYE